MGINAAFKRDGNGVPITSEGLTVTKCQTLAGSNATVATPIFKVTGSVQVLGLYSVVETVLGSNITAAYYRLNDQTAQAAISLASGVALSAAPVGSLIMRLSLVSVALALKTAAAGAVCDPIAATAPGLLMPFSVTQKTGGVESDIEFVYTTTNTPTSGKIKHYVRWIPLSDDGMIEAL